MRISHTMVWTGALLVSLAVFGQARAGDRIFANGFEPCCRIGGTVGGLSGSGLVVHLDAGSIHENNAISGNGPYDFVASVPTGTAWTVSVQSQPGGQTCQLANASGTMGSSNVTDVDVTCGGSGSDLIWDDGNWDDGNWQ